MAWQPNEDELRTGAPHVSYEIHSLQLAWEHHRTNRFAYTAWFVHCRNLMSFFDGKGKDEDLFARHYIGGTAWDDALKDLGQPDGYGVWWRIASRQAAHLTQHRVGLAPQNHVPREDITKHLLDLALQFVQMLPPPRVTWFGDLLLLRRNSG